MELLGVYIKHITFDIENTGEHSIKLFFFEKFWPVLMQFKKFTKLVLSID